MSFYFWGKQLPDSLHCIKCAPWIAKPYMNTFFCYIQPVSLRVTDILITGK